jgi:hypothetical protein
MKKQPGEASCQFSKTAPELRACVSARSEGRGPSAMRESPCFADWHDAMPPDNCSAFGSR